MLGQRINELRIAMGWSQVHLAEKLNISKQTVSNWENDNIQPSIEMLVRIAKLFHVSIYVPCEFLLLNPLLSFL